MDLQIAFDECHLAKGEADTSATREVVEELQTQFPNAAILYVSATAGHQPTHLAYMDRLGLWGNNCVFPNVETFVERMKLRYTISYLLILRKEFICHGRYFVFCFVTENFLEWK